MKRLAVPNRLYFYHVGFSVDCFNFVALLAEAFFAAKVLRATEFQMGLLGFYSALGYASMALWTGVLSDRVGRRIMVGISVTGLLLCYIATPYSPSMKVLYLVAFLRNVSTSFLWPALMAWMSETCEQKRLAGTIGWYNITWALGILLGMWIAGVLFEHVGPAAPFQFAAVYAVVMLAWVLLLSPKCTELIAHDYDMPPAESRNFVTEAIATNFLMHFGVSLVLYMYPKMAAGRLGETAQSMLHVVRMAGQVLAFFVFTHTAVWHFRRWPTLVAIGLSCCGLLTIGLGRVYGLHCLGFFSIGLGTGIAFMASSYYAMGLMQRKGLGGGIQETVLGAGSLVGPLYGGAVAKYTSVPVSIVSAVGPLMAAYIGSRVYARWKVGRSS